MQAVAKFNEKKIEQLLANPGIIRNRAKIVAAIANAKASAKIIKKTGSLSDFLWETVGGKTRQNRWKTGADIPAQSEESQTFPKRLKANGFQFHSPTT